MKSRARVNRAFATGILDMTPTSAHRRGTGGGLVFRFRRSPEVRPSTSGPHRFVEPADPRSGLALGAVKSSGLQMGTPLAVADASLRIVHCALSGCGKPRVDSIHWLGE